MKIETVFFYGKKMSIGSECIKSNSKLKILQFKHAWNIYIMDFLPSQHSTDECSDFKDSIILN